MSKNFAIFVHFLILVVIASLLPSTSGQVFSQGKCPNVTTARPFDLTRYLGQWYEIERFFHFFEMGLKCVTANYTSNADCGTIKVVNQGIYNLIGTKAKATGTGAVPNPNEPAKLAVTFLPIGKPSTINYWVLETDYENYSVVYNCNDYYFLKAEYAWILSRKNSLEANLINDIHDKLRGMGINPTNFERIEQQNC